MGKMVSLSQVILFFTMSLTVFGCEEHVPYSQSFLALSWPGQFCFKEEKCTLDFQSWDGKSFGIHGYWPGYNQTDISCLQLFNQQPDPYCKYPYYFQDHQHLLSDQLKQQLEQVWPQWGRHNAQTFRADEWNKHGVCYMKLARETYKAYSEDEIFTLYFELAVKRARQFRTITHHSNQFKSKQQFADLINLKIDQFVLECKKVPAKVFNGRRQKSYISQLRICYSLDQPGKETITSCFEKDLDRENKLCSTPLYLGKYRADQQKHREVPPSSLGAGFSSEEQSPRDEDVSAGMADIAGSSDSIKELEDQL